MPHLRERKKAQTRQAIIDAALDLFERRGYDTTTVDQIAAAADVSPRTFFRYFDGKLDVVLGHKWDDSRERFEALVAGRPATEAPLEAARQVVRDWFRELASGSGRSARRALKVVLSTPSLRPFVIEHFHDERAALGPVFAARLGVDPGELQPQLLAAVTGTVMWTVLDHWITSGSPPDRLVAMVDAAFAQLASGL